MRALALRQAADGYRFDTGPSLLLFPDKYRECFAALGEDIADHVDIVRVRARFRSRTPQGLRCAALTCVCAPLRACQVSPAYRAHFGDGTTFDLSYDMARKHTHPHTHASFLSAREQTLTFRLSLHKRHTGRAEGADGGA